MNQSIPKDRLDALVFHYLERVEAGESAAGVLGELCDENPEEAEALERGVALLRGVRLHPGPAEDGVPERVGPFRLLKRLGAGGMGVVYLASQQNPTRKVALKLVRPDRLWFEGYRERFTREIESAGRLAHPGIAPVYEMGEHEGVPWFSQEFVLGTSLSDLLSNVPARSPESLTGKDLRNAVRDGLEEEVPDSAWDEEFFAGTWVDVCLRIARQVAEGLQHAHERGVLHRDVKPSNVLLTPGGRAVLVDFGLASVQGTEKLTQTGAQFGSLHYMPPEQVDGRVREIGPRSDVYSLGVTLYELVTLRAPYASKSVQRLRGLILSGEATDPRRWNRAVSRDVNVVVQCAMDQAPERRYETALAFAADLAAAQSHRPIAARPAGLPLRTARWVKRNPAYAVGACAAFLLLVVTPLIFGFQGRRAARVQRDLNNQLSESLAERDALLAGTLDAFEDVVRWTAQELDDVPGFQEDRLTIIDKGIAAFTPILEARPDDPGVRLEQALMMRTRGDVLALLERHAEAQLQFDAAAVLLEEALDGSESDAAWLRQLASLRYQQGRLERDLGRAADAIELGRQAVEFQRQAADLAPEDIRNHHDLSTISSALAGDLFARDGSSSEAYAALTQALAGARSAIDMDPANPRANGSLYEALSTRGNWREDEGRNLEALSDLTEAAESVERGLALAPRDRTMRWQFAHALRAQARVQLKVDQDAVTAIQRLDRALDICDELIREFPNVPQHESERLATLDALSVAHRKNGDHARARELGGIVLEEKIDSATLNPEDLLASLNASLAACNLMNSFFFDESLGTDRFVEVLDLCDLADELLEPYARANPQAIAVKQVRMRLHYTRGATYNQTERHEELRFEADALRSMDLNVPVKHIMAGKLLIHWANRTGVEQGRADALAELEQAVAKGFEDLALWEQGEMEEELSAYPRVHELGEIVRSRARGL